MARAEAIDVASIASKNAPPYGPTEGEHRRSVFDASDIVLKADKQPVEIGNRYADGFTGDV
jgi:hypothetical protein